MGVKCKDFVFSGSDEQNVPKVKKKSVGNGKDDSKSDTKLKIKKKSVGASQEKDVPKVKKHSVPEKEEKSKTAKEVLNKSNFCRD